jgi:hypothetical protein
MTDWVVIPNWEKFQHRADRSLPWLKLYIELEGRDDWRQLSLAARGLLVCIWIEYRRSKGQLRTSDIPGRVAQKVPRRTLNSLVEAGFVALVDTQPAQVATAQPSRARSRDVDVDEDPPTPHRGAAAKPRKPKTTGWRLVRGTHGMTHVPDPNGTDRPPPEVRL